MDLEESTRCRKDKVVLEDAGYTDNSPATQVWLYTTNNNARLSCPQK